MKRRILFLFILLATFAVVHSQNKTDSTCSNVRGIIKINPLEALVGEVRIAYEKPIKHNMSLEFGVGYMYGIFGPINLDFSGLENFGLGINNVYKGFSLRGGLKFYSVSNYCQEGLYLNPLLFSKYCHTFTEDIYVYGLQTLVGYKSPILNNNFIIDFYLGLGCREILYTYHDRINGGPFNNTGNGKNIFNVFTPQLGFTIGFKI